MLRFFLLLLVVAPLAADPPRDVCVARASQANTFADCTAFATDSEAPTRELSFVIASTADRWPADVTMRIGEWRWRWRNDGKPRVLRLPAGRYEVEVSAADHRVAKRTIDTEVGRIVLEAIPRISGVVSDADGLPYAGAIVTMENDERLGVSEPDGTFAVAIGDKWPEAVKVTAPGFATRLFELPKERTDLDLGPIKLMPGGAVRVAVDGIASDDAAGADLMLLGFTPRAAASRPLHDDATARFDAVEAQPYNVVIRGAGPLQRFARRINVRDGNVADVAVSIVRRKLHINVTLGSEPLRDAEVHLDRAADARWEGSIRTDSGGKATAEVWQTGEFFGWIRSVELTTPYLLTVQIPDEEEINLDIAIPDRRIRGRLVDAATGQPVTQARIELDSERKDGMGSSLRVELDAQGRFDVRAVPAGHHRIEVRADHYLEPTPVEFDFGENDREREVTIRLAPGVERRIEVIDAAGNPLAHATVAEASGGRIVSMRQTDATGAVTFHLPAGDGRTLYVVPGSGSFAVVRVAPHRGKEKPEPLQVVVPRATSTLALTTRSTAGEPIGNVFFSFRYNGEAVPWEVVQLIGKVQGTRFATGASGQARVTNLPPGFYELWPVATKSEAEMAGGGVAPVQVDVRPGDNAAVLTFARR